MAEPTAHLESAPELPPVLGTVTLLVYGMEPDKTEVRIQYPDDALGANATGANRRAAFRGRVQSELAKIFELEALED